MYSWGDGSRGQLALHLQDGETAVTEPREVNSLPEQVLQAACGENHTLFLTRKGKIWTCGQNTMGQLGIRKSKNRTSAAVLEGLGTVVAVACGQEHALILCESGQMFAWGRGSEGQLGTGYLQKHVKPRQILIPLPPHMPLGLPVVQVACGNHHSLALTKGGDVFSWGKNTHGQLGLGKAVSLQPVPSHVCSLTGVPVIQVCAGGEYSLARSLSGSVYCCGANNAGQLGLNRVDERGRFTVCAVPAFRNIRVSSISCGEAHTVVLAMDGSVFTFGEGRHGQLGHNSTENELKPRRVEGLGGPAEDIACGSHHTLVLMSSGVLLAFGNGLKGQLGNGQTHDVLQPRPVQPTWSSDGDAARAGMKISAGWKSSFIHSVSAEGSNKAEQIIKMNSVEVEQWLTMNCNRGETKRKLTIIFSSSGNLVASFLRQRHSPSDGTVNVDLQAARQMFERLHSIPWINEQIDVKPLVGELVWTAQFMRSVDIFLVLPECHMFHEDQNVINSVLPLARAVVTLPESSMKLLREQWSCLELDFIKKHICMWKNALRFLLKSGLILQFNPNVKDILQVLKQMNKASKRTVPASEFHLVELSSFPQLLHHDLLLWFEWRSQEETPAILCRFPFLLDLQSKIIVFNMAAATLKGLHSGLLGLHTGLLQLGMWPSEIPPCPLFQLKLRRFALVEDTFRQLGITDHENFKKELVVLFSDSHELTVLSRKDFFLQVFKTLFAPDSELFIQNELKTLVWFPVKPTLPLKQYFLFGILCGLAAYNNTIAHLPFPKALFKKLLNVQPNLEDLMELSPVLGKTLKGILDESDGDVEDMSLTFSVMWNDVPVELDPSEEGKLVTGANRRSFINAYVDYVLNKSAERMFEEFQRGFFTVCERDVVELFQPHELMELMVGNEDYDWNKLRQNTEYEGEYHVDHPNIVRFWKVFEQLSADDKKGFFLFLTASSRVPILGMDVVKMRIQALPHFTEQHSPVAVTCHYILQLPVYSTKEMLRAKLIKAIHYNKDFWKDMVTITQR